VRNQTPIRKRSRQKARTKRKRPHEEASSLRLPKDLPWKLLGSILMDLSEYVSPEDRSRVETVVRSRDVDSLMALASDWNLQCMFRSGNPSTLFKEVKILLGAFLKKYPFEGNSQERVDAALRAVREGERQCSLFNRRGHKCLYIEEGVLHPIFIDAQTFVGRVLGNFSYEKVSDWCRHGPGSSTGTSKGQDCSYYKYGQWPYHVTTAARGHAERLIRSDERWMGALEDSYRRHYGIKPWELIDWDTFFTNVLTDVPGNRITTVPKDCRKDRPIAVEPTLNMMLQLGVDGHIRRRLKRWGIDLDNQFRNMRLAKEGSLRSDMWAPATLDLSNASDTVSLRIAKILLPPEWFEYVCAIRSPSGVLPSGERVRYSKLSSMGNGATFAIESLIFAAIAFGVCNRILGKWPRDFTAVYGDDIIVPEVVAPYLATMLEECGFTINTEKSFIDGPVKESCGSDWVHGRNVRPVYLDEVPEDVVGLFALRNLLNRWACQHVYGCESMDALPLTNQMIISWIPKSYRLWGPPSDTEVGTYLHGTCKDAPFYGSVFHYSALSKRCVPLKGNELHFRKLMAPLREVLGPNYEDYRKVVPVASGAFDVTAKGRWHFSMNKRRVASEWPTSYCSPDTIPLLVMRSGPV